MNIFDEINRNNAALLEASGISRPAELDEPEGVCRGCVWRDPTAEAGCTKGLLGPTGKRTRDDCYLSEEDYFRAQFREAEMFARDHFAANPQCHGVGVGPFHFGRGCFL